MVAPQSCEAWVLYTISHEASRLLGHAVYSTLVKVDCAYRSKPCNFFERCHVENGNGMQWLRVLHCERCVNSVGRLHHVRRELRVFVPFLELLLLACGQPVLDACQLVWGSQRPGAWWDFPQSRIGFARRAQIYCVPTLVGYVFQDRVADCKIQEICAHRLLGVARTHRPTHAGQVVCNVTLTLRT